MVPSEWIEACIRKAPCEDWRIILAFARYAGMRSHENRHYAMTMQSSFDRAVVEGAKIIGVTTAPPQVKSAEVVDSKVPQNPPPTVQDKGGNPETRKKPIEENPVNDWVCLASALADLPLSYPARTPHNDGFTPQNTGQNEIGGSGVGPRGGAVMQRQTRTLPATDPVLNELCGLWESIGDAGRIALLNVARSMTPRG